MSLAWQKLDPMSKDELIKGMKEGIFKSASAVLNSTAPDGIVVVQYTDALHWRLLILLGSNLGRRAIYWNPYGTALTRRDSLRTCVGGFQGWHSTDSFHSVLHALQPSTDDYQCGVWVHEALSMALEYARVTNANGDRFTCEGFDAFFTEQAAFRPIPNSGPSHAKRSATRANVSYSTGLRATLREVLWKAVLAGTRPRGDQA